MSDTDELVIENDREDRLAPLIKQFASDGRELIQQEINLAKTEIQDGVTSAATAGLYLGAGAVAAILGLLVLLVSAIIGLGVVLGAFWLSTLIVGGLILLIGAVILLLGKRKLSRTGLKPDIAVTSISETRD